MISDIFTDYSVHIIRMEAFVITFGVLSVVFVQLNYNNAVEFKFTNFVCETYNESWFRISHCQLRAVSRNKTILNINSEVLHPVNNIKVHLKFFQKANGYKPWLYDMTIDACRFLKNPYNPVVSIVYRLFKEFSNINHTCPFMGPQIIKGFYLRIEKLRLPIPTGEYLLAITWIFDNKPQFATNAYFKFVEDF